MDLRDGLDHTVTFAPRPIVLEGTVYFGDRPHPATVVFATNRAQDELQVETDEEGRYETVLFRPGTYLIRVQLAGRDGPGFVVMTNREATERIGGRPSLTRGVPSPSGRGLGESTRRGSPTRVPEEPSGSASDGAAGDMTVPLIYC